MSARSLGTVCAERSRSAGHDPGPGRDAAPDAIFLAGADDAAPAPHDRVDALDGVRTIAVGLVILFHLGVPGFSGGYLGVDVFFVLSGFLITSLLLRDVVNTGRIDLARFWARRVARLMPAVLVLLVVVGVWSLVAAPAFRRGAIGADLLWCLLYVGNWHFIASSSYFTFDGTTSPLLHLWSLGVEEQFYLLWPVVLSAVAMVLAGRGPGRHARRDFTGARHHLSAAIMATAAVLAAASAAAMLWWYAAAGPDRAYMGTDAKVFEPLLGAVLAGAAQRPAVAAVIERYAKELVVLGVSGLVLAVATLGSALGPQPFYFRGGAALTCLAVVALLAGASRTSTDAGLGALLTLPAVTYLGRISYGLYLWHWPWTVWLMPEGEFAASRAALVAALTLATSAASYHLVELPLRSGRFRRARPARILRFGLAGVAAGTIVPVLLGATPLYAGLRPPPVPEAPVQASRPAPGEEEPGAGDARRVPTHPSTVMLVGDSVPLQLFGALASSAEGRAMQVVNAAHGGCAAAGLVSVDPEGRAFDPVHPGAPAPPEGPACSQIAGQQSAQLASADPGIVLWWSRYEYADSQGPDGQPLRMGDPAFKELQRRTLDAAVDRLTANGARLVVVRPEPTGTRTAQNCTAERTRETTGECSFFLVRLRFQDEARRQWIDVLEDKARSDPRLRVIRMDDLFCRDDGNPCDDRLPLADNGSFPPPGDDAARPDGSHFSSSARAPVAATLLARAVAAAR